MGRPNRQPRILYSLIDGKWVATTGWSLTQPAAVRGSPDLLNFLIVCDYGDWSGFRTLEECLAQTPSNWQNRRPGFYWIEER